jgi:hypothetical protein
MQSVARVLPTGDVVLAFSQTVHAEAPVSAKVPGERVRTIEQMADQSYTASIRCLNQAALSGQIAPLGRQPEWSPKCSRSQLGTLCKSWHPPS